MTTLFEKDDAIKGYRIAITCRRYSKPTTVNQSGRHKAFYLTVRDDAYCVIEAPLSARPKGYKK